MKSQVYPEKYKVYICFPPLWGIAIFVCLIEVKGVGVHVEWQHGQSIELNRHERWILVSVGCDTASDVVQENSLAWCAHTLGHFVVLSVGMALHSKAYDMLESFHKSSISCSKLMLTIVWRVVGNHDGDSLISFNLEKLLVQPGEMIARIASLTPYIQVETIACMSVIPNQS